MAARHVKIAREVGPGRLSRSEKLKLTRLRSELLSWSESGGRQFPWRSPEAGNYEKIVVEVLLQRTTATAVSSFYYRFVSRFPGWVELAEAETDELEKLLKPLGLWRRRARSLVALASYAAGTGGAFPSDAALHANIPAVGQYISNAIQIFLYQRSAPLLDTNMARVIERVVRPRNLADIRHDPWLQQAAWWLVKGDQPARTNWAVLDFAALVCKPRRPLCDTCPARSYCSFGREQASPSKEIGSPSSFE